MPKLDDAVITADVNRVIEALGETLKNVEAEMFIGGSACMQVSARVAVSMGVDLKSFVQAASLAWRAARKGKLDANQDQVS